MRDHLKTEKKKMEWKKGKSRKKMLVRAVATVTTAAAVTALPVAYAYASFSPSSSSSSSLSQVSKTLNLSFLSQPHRSRLVETATHPPAALRMDASSTNHTSSSQVQFHFMGFSLFSFFMSHFYFPLLKFLRLTCRTMSFCRSSWWVWYSAESWIGSWFIWLILKLFCGSCCIFRVIVVGNCWAHCKL